MWKILLLLSLLSSAFCIPSRHQRHVDAKQHTHTEKYKPGKDYCTKRGQSCVPYYQCSEDGFINTAGEGLIDIRFGPGKEVKNAGGNCPQLLDVCCKDRHYVPDVTPTEKPYIPKCGSTVGKKYGNDEDLNIRVHVNKQIHNISNVAQWGAYPWMVAILKVETHDSKGNAYDNELNIYQCGGSLIEPSIVLTAAHCVAKFSPYDTIKVRLGEWDTQRVDDHPHYTHQDRLVKSTVIHDHYNSSNLFNDIALLYLQEPAHLDYHIDTICLPEPYQNFNYDICYATGWGKDHFGQEGKWQAILKEVDLPIVPRKRCQNDLRTSRLGCSYCLHDTFVCAGGIEGKDTCEGDGGSPLVCYDSTINAYTQVGIVAYGIGCGSTLPAVYVDVAHYKGWIGYQAKLGLGHDVFPHEYKGYEGDVQYKECVHRSSEQSYNLYDNNHICLKKLQEASYGGSSNQGGSYGGGSNNQGGSYGGSSNQGGSYEGSNNQGGSYGGSNNQGGSYGGSNNQGGSYEGSNSQGSSYGGSNQEGPYSGGSSNQGGSYGGSNQEGPYSEGSSNQGPYSGGSYSGGSNQPGPYSGGSQVVDPHSGSSQVVDPYSGGSQVVDPHPGSSHLVDPHPGSSQLVDPHPGSSQVVDAL